MNLDNIIRSEISQTQKDNNCMIPSSEIPKIVKFYLTMYRDRKQNSLLETVGWKEWEMTV